MNPEHGFPQGEGLWGNPSPCFSSHKQMKPRTPFISIRGEDGYEPGTTKETARA